MSTHDPDDGGPDPGEYDDVRGGPRAERTADQLIAEARRRVGFPGLLLQMFGAFSVALGIFIGVSSVTSSRAAIDWYYDWVEQMQQNQPPAQRQQLPPREDAVKSLQVEGPVYGIVGLVSGTFMFIGGMKMRSLRGYGLSMAGSVLAIFPGLCCCCMGLVPGIWAFVVLLNADVKRAFQLVARPAPLG